MNKRVGKKKRSKNNFLVNIPDQLESRLLDSKVESTLCHCDHKDFHLLNPGTRDLEDLE